jgi:AcrR family transcriptional regulator
MDLLSEKIIDMAKKLFSEKGYRQMRLTELANKMQVSRGNVTYYFPTKDSIITAIFQQYEENIDEWIDMARLPIEGVFTRRLYQLIIHDANILRDEKASALYQELMGTPVLGSRMQRIMKNNIKLLIDAECTYLSPQELDYYTGAITGAYQFMDKMYLSNIRKELSLFDYIQMKQIIRIRLLGTKNEKAARNIENAIGLLRDMDFTHIKLL